LVVELTYNDSSTEDVAFENFGAKGITTDPANGTALTVAAHNNTPVVVSCNGKTANTNNLTVVAKEVDSIVVKTAPTKTEYVEGQTLDLTGLEVTLIYNDTTTEDIVLADFDTKGIQVAPAQGTELTTENTKIIITHTASGKSVEQAITVSPAQKEITGFDPLADVTLDADENLVDLEALKASGKLPDKVTVTDGTNSADATITNWTGTYDGTVTGTYILTAIWTKPDGYVDDVDPIEVTINVIVNTVQTQVE